MRVFLRNVLVGVCGLLAVLLAAASATASDTGPQRSATPNVTAEIGYTRAQVHPGDLDTMTVSLVNHGPQSLDDNTSVHVTVTMPQDTDVNPTVVETIPGNAPTGSRNAVRSTRSMPLEQVFVRSAPGFFDVVVPAGSFGNSTSFRTYTFTLHVSPTAPQGAQLVGGGVAVALENYVGLTVTKGTVAPPPVVVAPGPPGKPGRSGKSGGPSGSGSSEWIQRWTWEAGWGCSGGSMSGSGGAGAGGSASGGSASGGSASGGSGCWCPVDQHMTAKSGGAGGSGGARCVSGGLAETGSESTWPLSLGVLALAAGALLMRIAHRRAANWSRP